MQSIVRDSSHPKYEQFVQHAFSTIGQGPLADFDPDHDFLSNSKFNSGVVASRCLAIQESHFESLNRKERESYRSTLGINDWTWHSSELFFRDQGRLNYLAEKLSIPIFPLFPELICRAGGDAIVVSPEDVERGTCQFHVVHWTGARPSPSLFSTMPFFRIKALLETFAGRRRGEYFAAGYEWLPERVAYSLWRQYYEQLFGPMPLKDRLLWSWRDFTRIARLFRRSLKFIVRSIRRS